MLKISDALRELIEENATLHFGFHHRLLNLSQTARFLRPAIEARVKKPARDSAIVMNLSRLQRELDQGPEPLPEFFVDNISVQPGLCALTIAKTPSAYGELNRLFSAIQERNGFITLTQGSGETTIIISVDSLALARRTLSEKPRYEQGGLGSVSVKFNERYLAVKGLLYMLLQQVALQNINVVEVASTATEFTIYMAEGDVELAFESIFRRFARRRRGAARG